MTDSASEHPPDERAPGARIAGRFEVVRCLGAGGMGRVYEVIQTPLARHAALKVLQPAASGDAQARFETEAELISRLRHPNNITLFDFGHTDEGAPYLLMELCRGPSLAEALGERGRVSSAVAIDLAIRICDAVAEAHRLGIVHRDLKPSNILLDGGLGEPDGVRVADYGIARAPDRPALTAPGGLIGTPAYMAPEQARGEPADARSDVHAIGAIIYRMLAGHRPFTAPSNAALLFALQTESPTPLDQLDPPLALDPSLVALVHLTLAKDPAHRPKDAGALGQALRALIDTGGGRGPPTVTATADLDPAPAPTRPAPSAPAEPIAETGGGPMPPLPSHDSLPAVGNASTRRSPRRVALAASGLALGALGVAIAVLPIEDRATVLEDPVAARRIAGEESPPSPPGGDPATGDAVGAAAAGDAQVDHGLADTTVGEAPPSAPAAAPRRGAAPREGRITRCQVAGTDADLCHRIPSSAITECHSRHLTRRGTWQVDLILKEGTRPSIRSRPALSGDGARCVADALSALRPPPGSAFATVQLTIERR